MNPKDYIINLLNKDLRIDGRKLDEYRKPIKIEYGVSSKSAEGSARVTMGDTIVIAGVKLGVEEPYPDMPDQGSIIVNAELSPLASPEFETGPPRVDAIELARIVDRGIRESKTIDFKKLCIKKDEKAWFVFIDLYPINDAGNLFDASCLAALAALRDTKYPKYNEKKERIVYEQLTDKKLKLDNLPVSCTMVKIKDKILVDPIIDEERETDARLTVFMLDDGTICAMQKGGDKSLTSDEILSMVDLAYKKTKELRKLL
jgi:exosome complex component RRP42